MRVPAILAFPPQTAFDFLIGERGVGVADCDVPLAIRVGLIENLEPVAFTFFAMIEVPSVRAIRNRESIALYG